jgi:pimeloyl-ACP methyl ester carboxylesterase
MTPIVKRLIILGFSAFSIYFGLAVSLRLLQTRLMFFPSLEIKATPKDINLIYDDLWLSVGQQKLNAWWIPSQKPNNQVILYLHGNSSNLGDLLPQIQIFHQLGLSTLFIDYRGYGHSSGDFPNEINLYEDGEAAWKYLIEKKRIAPRNIFVYGHSLGGAIAIELARRHPTMAGAIMEGTFTSMVDMVDYLINWQIFPRHWILTQYFDSISKVKSIKVPLLIIYGTLDKVVPTTMSQKLFAVSSSPKSLIIIPNAEHHNVAELGGKNYRRAILNFIQNKGH